MRPLTSGDARLRWRSSPIRPSGLFTMENPYSKFESDANATIGRLLRCKFYRSLHCSLPKGYVHAKFQRKQCSPIDLGACSLRAGRVGNVVRSQDFSLPLVTTSMVTPHIRTKVRVRPLISQEDLGFEYPG